MFRHRRNSQKPPDSLYAIFKQTYPSIGPGTNNCQSSATSCSAIAATSGPSSDPVMDHRHFGDTEEVRDGSNLNANPHDQWQFSPLLDNNSFNFSTMANQPLGCYTPTPGGSAMYHNQAGDLHTPNMGFQLGTPLSLPTSESHLQPTANAFGMDGIHSHMLGSTSVQASAAFQQQQSYAPSSFVHQHSGFETLNGSHTVTPKHDMTMDLDSQRREDAAPYSIRTFSNSMPVAAGQSAEKFRYQVTLNAPTAMVRHPEEIPITYLNKGQAYSMSIADTQPLGPSPGVVRYRTVIRISFEDEQQRQRPSACWQLWKEGRGIAESHLRAGRLQAVEYVDPNQGGDDQTKRPRVELETASFDSFAVTWTPQKNSMAAECHVAVRFNFLSTDFSHSKGVKGIPVRLCAKTEILSSGTPDSRPGPVTEVCFCKVKLFRDHGAERKLSNDVSHIKKTIDKLKQQIAQAESGSTQSGKRKRSGSKGSSSRPSKMPRHKRTWSISSETLIGPHTAEDDLHIKLATTEDMFTSTRPVSLLHLKGYPQDDPDKFPVALSGAPQDLMKIDSSSRKQSWDQRQSVDTSHTPSTNLEDETSTPSSHSMHSQSRSAERTASQPMYSAPPQLPRDWNTFPPLSDRQYQDTTAQSAVDMANHAVRIPREQHDDSFPDWIEALGVDPSYVAPPEKPIKPIACFYVLIKVMGEDSGNDYYRAVYLMERTLKDLVNSIAAKWQMDSNQITRTIRVNPKGLKILIDDETVQELPEGQDMMVEFSEIDYEHNVKVERGVDYSEKLLEMRLLF